MASFSHTIRRFNRFELKYMVTIREAEAIKKALGAYLVPDNHGDSTGAYMLSSLYYDGPDYRFYWEKVDGIRFRRKLRIRFYETGAPLTEESMVFVEIKQRLNRVTQKRRILMRYGDALHLCEQREIPVHDAQDDAVVNEVRGMGLQYDLRPASIIAYSRQALVGSDYDMGLRVTFDKDLRYRTYNLQLDDPEAGQFLFPPDWVVMEIKVNERIPYWLTELVAAYNLNLVRVSKYCRSIEMAKIPATPAWP